MKRSEVNRHISWAMALLEEHRIALPPFGYWAMEKWLKNYEKAAVIRRVMLGWDITDYGQERFEELGAVLFTLRNGSLTDAGSGTPYAEKLIILKDGQRLPLHYHASKTEDIINRAGGVLAVKLYNSLPDGQPDYSSKVDVDLDGIHHRVTPNHPLRLGKGESVTLRPYMYHMFWAEAGSGDLVCGEVSSINDDLTDNYNAEPVSRFSAIEEDAEILHPLCNEYEQVLTR